MIAEKLRLQEDLGRRSRITLKVLDDAFKELETDCFETFCSLAIEDDEKRLNCTLMVNSLALLKEKLQSAVYLGEAAREALIKTQVKTEEAHAPRNPT